MGQSESGNSAFVFTANIYQSTSRGQIVCYAVAKCYEKRNKGVLVSIKKLNLIANFKGKEGKS